jgi:hypothetical protein
MKLSEQYEDLIDEITFAILDCDVGDIGDSEPLSKLIAEQFDNYA